MKDIEILKDLITQAVQAGKSETSGLVKNILDNVKDTVKEGIETQLNGHLRDIKAHLAQQDSKIESMDKKIDELAPVRDGVTFAKTLTRFLKWVAPTIAILWGAFKWLKG